MEKTETVAEPQEPTGEAPYLPVNFSSFILSLGTSGLIHLGEEAEPDSGEPAIDLPNARQVIDLISLLQEKTEGNRTEGESQLMSQLLYTLRMKFVAIEKKQVD